jgi:hypothetical protein
LTRKALFGNPKQGDFGIIGELIIDEMLGAVIDIRFDPKLDKATNAARGTAAHANLSARLTFLNQWLKGVPLAKDVEVVAELSLGEDGTRSYAKGSLRLDVVVRFKGKNWVTFDLKTGKSRKGNVISSTKRVEYTRRFGARLVTIGIQI